MAPIGKNTSSPASVSPKQNKLLAALPDSDYQRLLPELEFMDMPTGLVLRESGVPMRYVYFPTSAVVSLVNITEDGTSAEIAATGSEGLVGFPLVMGGKSTPSEAVVQSPGSGYRLKAEVLEKELANSPDFQHIALHFTQALMTQTSQTALCNRLHSLDQQFCRWLLIRLDRLQHHEVAATQEFIASMLGVRRESVTIAASKLHEEGIILRRRGHITVVDRTKLEVRVCECYGVVKAEYDRLLYTQAA